jgi:hypothetical protein
MEWRPPQLFAAGGFGFFVSAIVVAIVIARTERPAPWWALTELVAFLVLGLTGVRATYWWALAFPPIVALVLDDVREKAERRATEPEPSSAGATAFAGVLLILIVSLLPWWRAHDPLVSDPRLVTSAPRGAVDALRATAPAGTRVFNAQPWGSWLELDAPAYPVFVDSRIELFPPSVWSDYVAVSQAREGWRSILERWDVGAVLLDRERQGPLATGLRSDPAWRLTYSDGDAELFVRSDVHLSGA